MADKEVKIKVGTDVELSKVQSLEDNINKIKLQKIQLDIQTNTARLEEVNSKIESTKAKLSELKGKADVDDSEVKQLETELDRLEADKIDIQLDIETGKLDEAKSKLDRIDDETINPQINTISAMEGIEQIGQGFDRLKQGASEIGQQMGQVLEAAGKQETNKSFLQMAVGADTAAQKMNDINNVVQQLPGDDTVMQGLLSSAVAKDANLTADALQEMGTSAADYFSAMSFYGKSATEAQQDMTNYLLAGNTAELERSPILQGHIDKLKEGTTIQERAKLLQEALNEEHWGGMSQQDTYNNKLETFNGMLERGKYNLGGMFQEGAKWGMDLVMQLDSASGGLVGMGIALAGFATPITDTIMGLGQMATGIKAIKDLEFIKWFKDLEIASKLSGVFSSVGSALSSLWGVLIANPIILVVVAIAALILAFIWAYNNVDWFREMVDNAWASIQGFADWISGVFMGAIQGLSDAFNNAGQTLQDAFTGAVQFVQDTLQGLYDYIMTLGGLLPEGVNITGNQIVDSIIAVMLFIATLPFQLAMIFVNIIASTLGFGNNFVQTMFNSAMNAVNGFIQWVSQIPSRLGSFLSNAISSAVSFGSNFVSTISNAASNAVSNFVSWISQLPQRLGEELDKMIQQALDFAARLPQIIGEAAANMVGSWVGGSGEESPGFMYDAFYGEIDEMDKVGEDFSKSIPVTMGNAGKNMVDSFNPNLTGTLNGAVSGSYGNTINLNLEIGSVDSEDRVREIIDVIRRELHWNNKTAGRTV